VRGCAPRVGSRKERLGKQPPKEIDSILIKKK